MARRSSKQSYGKILKEYNNEVDKETNKDGGTKNEVVEAVASRMPKQVDPAGLDRITSKSYIDSILDKLNQIQNSPLDEIDPKYVLEATKQKIDLLKMVYKQNNTFVSGNAIYKWKTVEAETVQEGESKA